MYVIACYFSYLAISIALTIWVARTLKNSGRVFLIEAFNGNEELADSVNRLLVVGFYLINVGYIALALKTRRPTEDGSRGHRTGKHQTRRRSAHSRRDALLQHPGAIEDAQELSPRSSRLMPTRTQSERSRPCSNPRLHARASLNPRWPSSASADSRSPPCAKSPRLPESPWALPTITLTPRTPLSWPSTSAPSEEMAPSLDTNTRRSKRRWRLASAASSAYKFEYFSPNRALLGALSGHVDPAHALSPFSEETAAIREQDIAFFQACRGRLQSQASLQHSSVSAALTLALPDGPASLLGIRPLTQANAHPDPFRQNSEDDSDQPCGWPGLPLLRPIHRLAGELLEVIYDKQPHMIHFEETTLIAAPIDRVFDLSRSVEVHLLANVHGNEQALATGGVTAGLVGLGQQVTWRAKHFGFWHDLTSEATAVEPPTYFQVTMVKGIFRSMQADHQLRRLPSGVN